MASEVQDQPSPLRLPAYTRPVLTVSQARSPAGSAIPVIRAPSVAGGLAIDWNCPPGARYSTLSASPPTMAEPSGAMAAERRSRPVPHTGAADGTWQTFAPA